MSREPGLARDLQASRSTEMQARAFYDRIAPDYDRMLDTARHRATRECFWQCAEGLLPPASAILDFGAGTGFDAEHFAALGHEVTAYDQSEGMIDMLRRRCAAQMAAGKVAAVAGGLDEARSLLAARAPFDAILCNFAVFSSIARLGPLFRLFGELARPGGVVLISIQNPWNPRDLRSSSFWIGLLGMPFTRTKRFKSAGTGHVYHHLPGQVRRAASPEFAAHPGLAPECRRTWFGRFSRYRLIVLRRR